MTGYALILSNDVLRRLEKEVVHYRKGDSLTRARVFDDIWTRHTGHDNFERFEFREMPL